MKGRPRFNSKSPRCFLFRVRTDYSHQVYGRHWTRSRTSSSSSLLPSSGSALNNFMILFLQYLQQKCQFHSCYCSYLSMFRKCVCVQPKGQKLLWKDCRLLQVSVMESYFKHSINQSILSQTYHWSITIVINQLWLLQVSVMEPLKR